MKLMDILNEAFGDKYIPKNDITVNAWVEEGDEGEIVVRIDYIEVPTNMRHIGIGTDEVQNIIQWAKSKNAELIVIESEREAIGFWTRMGFDIDDQGSDVSTGYLEL